MFLLYIYYEKGKLLDQRTGTYNNLLHRQKHGNDIRVEYIKICSILYASFKPKTSIVCEKWHMALKYLQRHTGLLDI